jgi:hypothetical protein
MEATASARISLRPALLIAGSALLLMVSVGSGHGVRFAAPAALLVAVLATGHRALLRWQSIVVAIVVVLFFIPIKRYALPSSLPFNLEPYRVLIALVALAWIISLLIDPRVRLRRSGFEGPLAAFALVVVASVAVNAATIEGNGLSQIVTKTLTFWASFLILFYFVVSVVRTRAQIERVVRWLVGCGAVVAAEALYEYRTHDNLFNHLAQLFPYLQYLDPTKTAGLDASYLTRSGGYRAYASAAHPIELSAVLVMLLPLAIYLFKSTRQRRWLLAALLLGSGLLSTLSRTGFVMLAVLVFVYTVSRPRHMRRLLPLLVPVVVVVYAAVPHALGSLYAEFFPKGGIVAQQNAQEQDNSLQSTGRLARIGPAISEWSAKPVLGEGFGSRVTSYNGVRGGQVGPVAQVFDDQWLTSLLETGALGVIVIFWLLRRPVRRLKPIARRYDADGWLALALIAGIDAFTVGMLTFDAFGFIQVTILTFLLMALAAALLKSRAEP